MRAINLLEIHAEHGLALRVMVIGARHARLRVGGRGVISVLLAIQDMSAQETPVKHGPVLLVRKSCARDAGLKGSEQETISVQHATMAMS